MADDLRARLIAAKISGAKTGQGYEFRTNENAADVALGVVTDWLLDEAGDIQAHHDGEPGDNQMPIVEHLRWLAASLTQPSTEEKRDRAE